MTYEDLLAWMERRADEDSARARASRSQLDRSFFAGRAEAFREMARRFASLKTHKPKGGR